MRLCVVIILVLVLVALLLLGLFLLIPFPIALFPAIVKTQVWLREKANGPPPKATFYWENLPATQWYNFYLFNVSNPDEVLYEGKTAALIEIGPYAYAESEFKDPVFFFENGNRVYYRNNKTWIYTPGMSCSRCTYADRIVLPNAAYQTLVQTVASAGNSTVLSIAADVLALILGESPMRSVPVAGVLFEGYSDPLVDLLNSALVQIIFNLLPNPPQIPQIPAMGYFPSYNHTNDGDYETLTGKDTTDNLGLIQKWYNNSQLPWFVGDYARNISGSGDGSFQQPSLSKSAHLKQFQSFICRFFYLHYEQETTVRGISAYQFKMDDDTYDTTTDLNMGYRLQNTQRIDFYGNWACGANHTYNPSSPVCISQNLNCNLKENWCTPCCNGTWTSDNVFMPKGMFPLMCLPGQIQQSPFIAFITQPHFLGAPDFVPNSLIGMHPDPTKHQTAFDIQPTVGSTVGGDFRMQLTVPIFSGFLTEMQNLINLNIPTFWLEVHVDMHDYAHNYIYFNTVTIPQIVLGLGIGFVAVAAIGALLLIFYYLRKRRSSRQASIDKQLQEISAESRTLSAQNSESTGSEASVREAVAIVGSSSTSTREEPEKDEETSWI